MDLSKKFELFMAHLAKGLGHADQQAGLSRHCTGLMLPLSRKSVEPMAARLDPLHASAHVAASLCRQGPVARRRAAQPRGVVGGAQGTPGHGVLADAGYGIDYALRQGLSDRGPPYLVGVTSAVVVWPPGVEPLAPKPYSGMGCPTVMPRRTAKRQPLSVKALAQSLPGSAWQSICWREGANEPL